MNNKGCIFCKIVRKESPAEVLYETKDVVAFPNIKTLAPIHLLIIPKEHITSINEVTDDQQLIMGELIIAARILAVQKGIAEDGYKLLFRVGKYGGQEIPHIHLHLIGGAPLTEDIHPQ